MLRVDAEVFIVMRLWPPKNSKHYLSFFQKPPFTPCQVLSCTPIPFSVYTYRLTLQILSYLLSSWYHYVHYPLLPTYYLLPRVFPHFLHFSCAFRTLKATRQLLSLLTFVGLHFASFISHISIVLHLRPPYILFTSAAFSAFCKWHLLSVVISKFRVSVTANLGTCISADGYLINLSKN